MSLTFRTPLGITLTKEEYFGKLLASSKHVRGHTLISSTPLPLIQEQTCGGKDMSESIREQIMAKIEETSQLDCRLVLLVDPSDSSKTGVLDAIKDETGAPIVNISEELSKRLVGFAGRQRIAYVSRFIDEIISSLDSELVLLDQTQILFDATLRQDPLSILQRLATSRQIVATWRGVIQNNYLTYSSPGNLEYRSYPVNDLVYVVLPERV